MTPNMHALSHYNRVPISSHQEQHWVLIFFLVFAHFPGEHGTLFTSSDDRLHSLTGHLLFSFVNWTRLPVECADFSGWSWVCSRKTFPSVLSTEMAFAVDYNIPPGGECFYLHFNIFCRNEHRTACVTFPEQPPQTL